MEKSHFASSILGFGFGGGFGQGGGGFGQGGGGGFGGGGGTGGQAIGMDNPFYSMAMQGIMSGVGGSAFQSGGGGNMGGQGGGGFGQGGGQFGGGGFGGKTVNNVTTTYERGGSDRTAADLGILFHKNYETSIDFENLYIQYYYL